MAPMGAQFSIDDPLGPRYMSFLKARARGGVGLIITETARVNDTYVEPARILLHNDAMVSGLRPLTEMIHSLGCKIGVQLGHAGRQTEHLAKGGVPPVAPSPIPCPVCRLVPRELTRQEIKALVQEFAQAARRSKEAGFDVIELQAAHGYLLSEFLSPYANKRTDEYGGDIGGRCRFPLEVLRSVKEEAGFDIPVGLRMNGEDFVPGGISLEDAKVIAVELQAGGADFLDVSAGFFGSYPGIVPPYFEPPGWRFYLAEAIKSVVRIPVIAVGRVVDPLLAEEILRQGKADFISMGRPLVADPELPNKAARGEFDEIRKCIGCNVCMDREMGTPIICSVNPQVGFEDEMPIVPTTKVKEVVVVGGGPAGLETALVAQQRGHSVTLVEKDDRLGGQMLLSARPPGKEDFLEAVGYLVSQIGKAGVEVHTGRAVTAEEIEEMRPDAVVVAVGAEPVVPPIPGADRGNVVQAWDVLAGNASVGEKVVVIGGGSVGLETAHFLAAKGAEVIVCEMVEHFAGDMGRIVRFYLRKHLDDLGVRLLRSATVIEIRERSVSILQGEHRKEIDNVDTVVLATGVQPRKTLAEALAGKVPELHVVGDASKPGKVREAIEDGFRTGLAI